MYSGGRNITLNTIYLIRHGENKANLTKEFSYKKVDYPLTPKGVLQARQTAEYFKDKHIDEIYTSPLKRARETAEIIAEALGLKVVMMEQFREVNVGELEDCPPDAATWAVHNRILGGWLNGHPEVPFPGGENYFQLLARMREGMRQVVSGRSGKHILVVAHGGIISATLRDLCQNVNLEALGRQENHNCSITEIELAHADGRLQGALKAWAMHSHLYGRAAELVSGSPDFK
jgi:broad specificity phosphatase PhoE